MTGFSTRAFTDPDDFRSALADLNIGFVMTGRACFSARVRRINMRGLRLLEIEEIAPRVAFVSVPPSPLSASFPLGGRASLVWNGIRLRRGDLMLHAPGDRFHQRTTGATRWGLISILPQDLASYGRALLDVELATGINRLVHPSAHSSADLLRLHSQAHRLARAKPALLDRREVARALEQDLIHALVMALGTGRPGRSSAAWRRRAAVMARFERALAVHGDTPSLPALCAEIGVPERTLRIYCTELLGRSPIEYARLRRLNLARAALLRAQHDETSVARIARSLGFSEPGRFAVAYRGLFGEAPLATLLRARSDPAESA
jgi:AraC-like DNA-binding protein